jgi:hypothetical protein
LTLVLSFVCKVVYPVELLIVKIGIAAAFVSVSIRVYIRDGQLGSDNAHALGSAITEIKFV